MKEFNSILLLKIAIKIEITQTPLAIALLFGINIAKYTIKSYFLVPDMWKKEKDGESNMETLENMI